MTLGTPAPAVLQNHPGSGDAAQLLDLGRLCCAGRCGDPGPEWTAGHALRRRRAPKQVCVSGVLAGRGPGASWSH